MHSVVVKTNLAEHNNSEGNLKKKVDHSSKKKKHYLVCPKPRRPLPSIVPEVLKPLRCPKHRFSSMPDDDGKTDIFDMFNDKGNRNDNESKCVGCSSPCYVGSPPRRTDNPLIHDVEFIHQMEDINLPPYQAHP